MAERVTPIDGAGALDVHAVAARRLAKVGQRHTRQRRAILDLIVAAGRPVRVPDLMASARDGVAQSSLYRNLVVLEDVGVLQRVVGWGHHDRFELAEALSGHHHHHLKCVSCGLVVDIPTNHGFERAVGAEAAAVSAELGFEVTGHSVDLYGRCASCTGPGAASAPARPKLAGDRPIA